MKISWSSIKHKKLSFGLTVLGIVIGIAAIVSLVSIGEGLQSSITETLEEFGGDKIMVTTGTGPPGMTSGLVLEDEDVEDIKELSGVESAVGLLIRNVPIEYNDQYRNVYVWGMNVKEFEEFFFDISSFNLEKGRLPKTESERSAVIGYQTAYKIFGEDVRLKKKISILGKEIKVVGILEEIGNAQDDQSVALSLEVAKDVLNVDEITMIMAKATDEGRAKAVAADIEEMLEDKYGENSFMAMTTEELGEMVSGIIGLLSLALGGIASIALLVAGVGIANTMFTSVLERTRQIGVMKAVGATDWNIIEMFLIESAMIGLIGGIVGVAVGIGISEVIEIAAANLSIAIAFKTVVTPQLILMGLGFSVLIGVLSGVVPARRAAKLNPVDALRYE